VFIVVPMLRICYC